MKILGIRVSSDCVRYAILEKIGDKIVFVNKTTENRLVFPANFDSINQKLLWIKNELERIIRQNTDIARIVIKTNEFLQENKSIRATNYVDAVCILVAAEKGISVYTKLYSQIGATNGNVKERAEHKIGRTEKYWDSKMADATLCAYQELGAN